VKDLVIRHPQLELGQIKRLVEFGTAYKLIRRAHRFAKKTFAHQHHQKQHSWAKNLEEYLLREGMCFDKAQVLMGVPHDELLKKASEMGCVSYLK